MRKSKMESLKALVISIVVIIGIVTSFFTAMTVWEQLNIHPWIDIIIAGMAGIGTALFQAALIGFSRFIRGVPIVKIIMLVAACFLTSLTIMGVYSALQSSFFRNVVQSGNYQRLSKQSELLQQKFERQLELNHITRSELTAKQLEDTNNKLSDAENSGSGSARNQWATNLSAVTGFDPNAISFGRHTVIGLAIDLCYYLALWFLFYGLLFREKTPLNAVLPIEDEYFDYDEDYRSWQKNRNGKPEVSSNGNGNGKPEKKNNSLNSENGVSGKRKKKQQRINKLARLLEAGYPVKPKQNLADKIGVTVETLNKYLELPEIKKILEEESIEI